MQCKPTLQTGQKDEVKVFSAVVGTVTARMCVG